VSKEKSISIADYPLS